MEKGIVMKRIYNDIKTFVINLFSSGLGWIVIIIAILLFIFHDECPRNKKAVHMKEDVMYVKPISDIK